MATDDTSPIQNDLLTQARDMIRLQSEAIAALAGRLNGNYSRAIDLILSSRGHLVVSGMGKSGLIAQKLAATFASTGSPSFFVHPADALHGDLGMITPKDVVMVISNSGETDEIVRLLPHIQALDVPTIALLGRESSSVGRQVTVALDVSVDREACPHNLVPTNSILATMAMGDTLAVSLMRARNFQPRDFAKFHPAGTLGQRLLTPVRDTMFKGPLPLVDPERSIAEALTVMTQAQHGLLIVVRDGGQLAGIVTDGDLRRGMQRFPNLLEQPVKTIMSSSPITIHEDAMLAEAEERMVRLKVSALIVVDDNGKIRGIAEIFNQH